MPLSLFLSNRRLESLLLPPPDLILMTTGCWPFVLQELEIVNSFEGVSIFCTTTSQDDYNTFMPKEHVVSIYNTT
jgi:hypothetical protein